jgi:gliding motility-associated protein GldC
MWLQKHLTTTMRKSEIKFDVLLDEQSIPEQIHWTATENPNEGVEETKAIYVGVWDHYHKGTLALPLWTKDMDVMDMKRFAIEIVGSLSETIVRATGDGKMGSLMEELCKTLTKNLQEEMKAAQQQQQQ